MKDKKLKRAITIYSNVGKNGGFIRAKILPKIKRYKGVDGIRLEWASDTEAKKGESNFVCMKDWECLEFISALSSALLYKNYLGRKKRRINNC